MSAAAIAINLAVAALLVFAALLTLGLCRAAGRPAPIKEEPRGLTVWDFDTEDWLDLPPGAEPGPKQMTRQQIADTDDLELLYLCRPYERPTYDPAWDAGRERLWDAARDTTNTAEGEA